MNRTGISKFERGEFGGCLHQLASVAEESNHDETIKDRLPIDREDLRTSEERYRIAFQLGLDSMHISSVDDGTFVEVNEAFVRIMGFAREELIGRTAIEMGIWVDFRDRNQMIELLLRNQNCRDFQARFRRKNGEIFWGLLSASIIDLNGVPHILSINRDTSEMRAAEETIKDLDFYDPLTHLPNRKLLFDRLRLASCSRSSDQAYRALLFVDLDNFSLVNDTLGHRSGDLLLQEAARRLTGCLRDSDLVARFGGDEFVLMVEHLSDEPGEAAAQAETIGKKILAVGDEPYLLAGEECHCSFSIGTTIFSAVPENPDDVLQRAEIAMFQAKNAGRNTLCSFAPSFQIATNARAALEGDLRSAIKNKQFVLHYQPQIENGRVTGSEALIRWNHPTRGLLPPAEFIQLAEETGLILQLGDWVIESACSQIGAWAGRKETSDLTVAVNISARQFRQPTFAQHVLDAIDRTKINPRKLRLEITENALLEKIDDVIRKMTDLRSHGLSFSLDDFGTGYSSLSYLNRLPLEGLKIDRSFVGEMRTSSSSRAIAQCIIFLAQEMDLSVIAEGVETEAQQELLTRLGCNSFQGYLFSRPLPAEEFESLLSSYAGGAVVSSSRRDSSKSHWPLLQLSNLIRNSIFD